MRMVRRAARTAVLAAVLVCAAGAAFADPVQLLVAGRKVSGPPTPEFESGTVWGPLAACAEAMGGMATWDPGSGCLSMTTVAGSLKITAGARAFYLNGEARALPFPAKTVGGALVCPLAKPLEALGYRLVFNSQARSLTANPRLFSLQVRGDSNGVGVYIRAYGPVQAKADAAGPPERVFVDLSPLDLAREPYITFVGEAGVRRVRFAQFKDTPATARFVMDLAERRSAVWEPSEDGCGGVFRIGTLQGDEPMIDRRAIEFRDASSRQIGRQCTVITCKFSDPVEPTVDVTQNPAQVALDFPDVSGPAAPFHQAVDGDFIREMAVTNDGGGMRLRLDMRQFVRFKTDVDPANSTVTVTFWRASLRGQIIVIDPGHGGKDSGAVGRSLLEKNVNLDVAKRVAALLTEMGANVVLTRDQDVFVDLFERPAIANRAKADLFLSIHCNAMPHQDTAQGTESYWYTRDSKCLAMLCQRQLVDTLGRQDRGVRTARFVVIRETTMPSCLVELMFIDHKNEEPLLAQANVRQMAAAALVEGLRQYVEGSGSTPLGAMLTP